MKYAGLGFAGGPTDPTTSRHDLDHDWFQINIGKGLNDIGTLK